MYTFEMPRKSSSFRLDERAFDVIYTLAERAGLEPNRYVETYFFNKGKECGLIEPGAEPLKETRGGGGRGAGRTKGAKNKPKSEEDGPTAAREENGTESP